MNSIKGECMNEIIWTHEAKADRSTTMINNHKVSVFRITLTHYVLYIDGARAQVKNKVVNRSQNKQQLMRKGANIVLNMPALLLPYPERLPTSHVKSTRATGMFLSKILK